MEGRQRMVVTSEYVLERVAAWSEIDGISVAEALEQLVRWGDSRGRAVRRSARGEADTTRPAPGRPKSERPPAPGRSRKGGRK